VRERKRETKAETNKRESERKKKASTREEQIHEHTALKTKRECWHLYVGTRWPYIGKVGRNLHQVLGAGCR